MKYIRMLVALTLFLSATTQADTLYENAEEGNTNHWLVYDNEPSAASITNVYDPERGSKVIQFSGTALENGYSIGDEQWNNQTERTVRWSMQYAESFTVYISIQTTQGHRYIYYTPEDENRDIDGEYIHYGLGSEADNGRWKTFTRDLVTDLETMESGNEIISVDGFLIRGSGKVDDIMLLSGNTPAAKLLFSSGFEDGVYIDDEIVADSDDYRFIRGKDTQTGYSWPIDVLGAGEDTGLHYVGHDNFEALESRIETVIGHNGQNTKALYVAERYDNGDYTQLPYEINNIQEGRKDLYIRYWMKMDSASLQQRNMWRALFEWKTKDYDNGDGFRLISYIYTDDDGKPYWHWQGDANPENPIWEVDNKKIPVPMDEWFLTEYYWHWSEGDDGRALWKINGEVIGDHKGATTRNSKPIDFIMLSQIYGNGNPKHQWIDDVEIWDSLPAKYSMRKLRPPAENKIYFSAYPDFSAYPAFAGEAADIVTQERIENFQQLAGKKIVWASFDNNWNNNKLTYPKDDIHTIHATDVFPLVRILPRNYPEHREKKITLEEIINGKYDTDLHEWAQAAKKDNIPLAIDFGIEMNGDWNEWSGINNGAGTTDQYGNPNVYDGPERYRDAYRHIIDIFRAENVTHITWFFHPNTIVEDDAGHLTKEWNAPRYYYPGDAYIDWIGLSLYGAFQPMSGWWDSFDGVFKRTDDSGKASHERIREISDQKPFALLEFGVTDHHPEGTKSNWLEGAFDSIVNNTYIKFQAISYWHENWENDHDYGCPQTVFDIKECESTLRIDSSVEANETFQTRINDSRFISNFTLGTPTVTSEPPRIFGDGGAFFFRENKL